jgi:prevent-host-death family protein
VPQTIGAHGFREKFGWYVDRAAAGEGFLITRRGKPYARLVPPHEQLDLPAPGPAEVVQLAATREP